jgi:CHAD domain-containing protein
MSVALPNSLAALLVAGLQRLRRRYRKKLARCQRKFSEASVHDLRIETRRLLAMLDLLRALRFDAEVRKPRKALKRRLDAFDDLRDTHVCLALLKPLRRELPEARAFDPLWRRRERQLIARLRRKIKATKQARLQKRLKALEKMLLGATTKARRSAGPMLARTALRETFARVLALRRRIRRHDTRTIHRTRVAFKRFRYLCELLQPLLPGLTREQLERLRMFQTLMGDIQDSEVLLAAVAAAIDDEQVSPGTGQQLRALLQRRRRDLIDHFLATADDLFSFDPARLNQPLHSSPQPSP